MKIHPTVPVQPVLMGPVFACLAAVVAAADPADAPLYLPYKALVSTISNMVFNEAEAHRIIEILSEKAGIIQDTWHTVRYGRPDASPTRRWRADVCV